jgi:hypothetical protein
MCLKTVDPQHSTILELRQGYEVDSHWLSGWTQRQTIILDACREIVFKKSLSEGMRTLANAGPRLNPEKCRKYYKERIMACAPATIVAYSCDIDETAQDDSRRGGIYSFHLLRESRRWAQSRIPDSSPQFLSISQAHELASTGVRREASDRQNPQIQKPRSAPYFPFAVVA